MFIIVREFFKIKNERPEEYIENYENALKLLHLQHKYNENSAEKRRIYSQDRLEPPRKIIKSGRRKKSRKKRSPNAAFKSLENVLSLYPESSSKKRGKHHVSQSNIQQLHPKAFDLYSSYRHPNDPFPEIQEENHRRHKVSSKNKRSRKKLKSKNLDHHKSGSKQRFYNSLTRNLSNLIKIDITSQKKIRNTEEHFLRKSKSTFMSKGWGVHPGRRDISNNDRIHNQKHTLASNKSTKSNVKVESEEHDDSSSDSNQWSPIRVPK